MSMTDTLKDELARVEIIKTCCRKTEVVSFLRFAGGIHIIAGKVVVEIELDTAQSIRRLRKSIHDIYGYDSEIIAVASGGLRKNQRYQLRIHRGAESLAKQVGLLDNAGRPILGLPPAVVRGKICDIESLWRAAILSHGSLTEPGRSSALEIGVPNHKSAMALVGAARRLNVLAKSRVVRGVDRVLIRDGDVISDLLKRLGAHQSVLDWEDCRVRREVRGTVNRLANFDDANLRRSVRAAVTACARVKRALEILGDRTPHHLAEAGRLRIENKQASLEELGSLANPTLTKDAVAGRIRRLLAMADKRAEELGIPSTEDAITPNMYDGT